MSAPARVAWHHLRPAWERDRPFRSAADRYWLDVGTGEVWLYSPEIEDWSEEVWQEPRAFLAESGTWAPVAILEADDRYREVPVLGHGDHQAIFRAWLGSLPPDARGFCNPVSVGGTGKNLRAHGLHEVWEGWHAYRREALHKRASEWARRFGCEVAS